MNDVSVAIQPFFHQVSGTWTHVVSRGRDAVVIDPVLDYDAPSGRLHADSAHEVLAYIAGHDLHVHGILETHAHADHLSAAAVMRAQTAAPIAIGKGIRLVQSHFAEVFHLAPDDAALTGAFDRLLGDGDVIDAGALRIEVLATPGHTPDGISYRVDGNVFVGDTLFAPDVGTARCDFPGASAAQLYASIQQLHAMPDDTVLWLCHDYPPDGREPQASVGVVESKRDNRILRSDMSMADFCAARHARDATLPAPTLLYPSLQVNIRGGRLPPPEHGCTYLRTPVHVDPSAAGL